MIRIIIFACRNIISEINWPEFSGQFQPMMMDLLLKIQRTVTNQFARQVVLYPAADAFGDA